MLDYYLFKQVYDLFVENRFDEAKTLLSELQARYIELADENEDLKTQVQEFEDLLYLAKNVEFDGMSYWLRTGTVKQGPFCQACFDKDGQLHRLQEHPGGHSCTTCGTEYPIMARTARTYVERPPKVEAGGKVIQLYK